jgi:hypothetical protein
MPTVRYLFKTAAELAATMDGLRDAGLPWVENPHEPSEIY